MGFLRNLISVIRFAALPQDQRQVTFYSEGENYWPYLAELVNELLDNSSLTINYISSSAQDPGVQLRHKQLNTFVVDEGHVRNYLFENLATDIMIMTMPDLGSFQIKRSQHPVHYVYVQHSLVSLHMAYREGAFDEFDTVFCSGPHHIAEIEAIQAESGKRAIHAIPHGYSRLDLILKEASEKSATSSGGNEHSPTKHILFAPTWGSNCAIESGAAAPIISKLLIAGHRVTLRPHPQTIKLSAAQVQAIVDEHSKNPQFSFEANVTSQDSLHSSDIMICDWSGAALDYAFGLGKPVLFLDVPKKINNPNYTSIDLPPFEESIREIIGTVCSIDDVVLPTQTLNYEVSDYVFNPGQSAKAGAKYIIELAAEIKTNSSTSLASAD